MKININNTRAVQMVLDAVQGSASVRLYTAEAVALEVAALEKSHMAGLPKAYWKGVKVWLADWDKGSKRNPNQGTSVRVERGATGWFVTGVKRYYKPTTTPAIETRGPDFDALARHLGFLPESAYHLARR